MSDADRNLDFGNSHTKGKRRERGRERERSALEKAG
jgi:hypothetical protein